jgi:hypothetical protein
MGTSSTHLWTLAACLAASALAGCTKTGLAWVNEPESGVDLEPPSPRSPNESIPRPADPAEAARPAAQVVDPGVPDNRPRLDRTITLGGESAFGAREERTSAETSSGPTNVVNVYVMPSAPSFAYGSSYGGFYAPRGGAFLPAQTIGSARAPAAPAALRPGLDWPSVPNHGPAFPYRMGPASPWEGTDPRRR